MAGDGMRYRIRLSCRTCFDDPMGCFPGGSELSEETFESPEGARDYGDSVTRDVPWDYQVVEDDEIRRPG